MEEKKYVDFDKVITTYKTFGHLNLHNALEAFNEIPAADVLPRDEAIKMGAELAAMHCSDATSQQLEDAYLKGVEDGMIRRDVRPVVRGKWKTISFLTVGCSNCQETFHELERNNFCPNCGADMREVINE